MRFGIAGLVAVCLLIPDVVKAESGEVSVRPLLVIRTYNTYRLSSDNLRVAEDAASAVLSDVGIDVRWIYCGQENRKAINEPRRCGQTPAPNEVILRIQSKGSVDASQSLSMGFTLVSRRPEDYRPVLSTVFADVVALIARDAGVDARRLLGYAVAHEIGHLLLNSPQHSSAGLMRALWSRLELRERRTGDWVFSSDEAETMRLAVAARINARP